MNAQQGQSRFRDHESAPADECSHSRDTRDQSYDSGGAGENRLIVECRGAPQGREQRRSREPAECGVNRTEREEQQVGSLSETLDLRNSILVGRRPMRELRQLGDHDASTVDDARHAVRRAESEHRARIRENGWRGDRGEGGERIFGQSFASEYLPPYARRLNSTEL